MTRAVQTFITDNKGFFESLLILTHPDSSSTFRSDYDVCMDLVMG